MILLWGLNELIGSITGSEKYFTFGKLSTKLTIIIFTKMKRCPRHAEKGGRCKILCISKGDKFKNDYRARQRI